MSKNCTKDICQYIDNAAACLSEKVEYLLHFYDAVGKGFQWNAVKDTIIDVVSAKPVYTEILWKLVVQGAITLNLPDMPKVHKLVEYVTSQESSLDTCTYHAERFIVNALMFYEQNTHSYLCIDLLRAYALFSHPAYLHFPVAITKLEGELISRITHHYKQRPMSPLIREKRQLDVDIRNGQIDITLPYMCYGYVSNICLDFDKFICVDFNSEIEIICGSISHVEVINACKRVFINIPLADHEPIAKLTIKGQRICGTCNLHLWGKAISFL
jgi:hypothetical protein